MENKINIAELLKDCPKGMELDCTTWENVTFEEVRNNTIIIRRNNKEPYFDTKVNLNQYGCCTNYSDEKCIIFPKGETTWEGFHRPFVEGDVIYTDNFVAILSHITEDGIVWYHCYYCINTEAFKAKCDFGIGNIKDNEFRLATEEEKQKLFDAIRENGYHWDAETKKLERLIEPKFKVGDKVQSFGGILVTAPDNWEIVPNKFDVTTLKPFESRVLVREGKTDVWQPAFYGFFNQHNKRFYSTSTTWLMCIPYNEDTKHLLGTTNDCDDFYKTW